MTSTATAADEFKLAFFEAAVELFANDPDTREVNVTYGYPGDMNAFEIVSFLGMTSEQSHATIGQRSRDEELTLEISISCAAGGGQEMELPCAQRAYKLLRMLEYYARKTDTTMGGTVQWCFLTGHESSGYTDEELLRDGRCIEILARFTARARVT